MKNFNFLQEFDDYSLSNLPLWDNQDKTLTQEVIGFINPKDMLCDYPIVQNVFSKLVPTIDQWRFIPLIKEVSINGEVIQCVVTDKETESNDNGKDNKEKIILRKGLLLKCTREIWYQLFALHGLPRNLTGKNLEDYITGLRDYVINFTQLKDDAEKQRLIDNQVQITKKLATDLTKEQRLALLQQQMKELGVTATELKTVK